MSETYALVQAIKTVLRSRGLTYREVGERLGLAESSVKRLFARRDFSLRRLDQLCELLDLTLGDLLVLAREAQPRLSQLSWEQEDMLVSDTRLLLIAVCVTNRWTYEEILDHYRLTAAEIIRALARLDRLKLIELQPGNRVRLLISPDFRWIEQGPIERFFERQVQTDFFNARFDGAGDVRLFTSGMLSSHSAALLGRHIGHLAREFRQLHEEDEHFPLAERHGTSLVIAMRSWELAAFARLRR